FVLFNIFLEKLSSPECDIPLSTVCEQMRQMSPTSPLLSQTGVFCSVCPQSCSTTTPLPSINSSVEEYYAELPKVTQSVTLELESRRPHPNRPKRPHPHTDSAHSHSPSPVLSNEQNLLLKTTAFDQSTADLSYKHGQSHINDHRTLDNGSTVYAEVNDAFVYKTLPHSFSLAYIPSKLSSHADHYELTDYSVHHPSFSHSLYTKICDTTHKNRTSVVNNTSEVCPSNLSHLNPLSNALSQYNVSADASFGRTSLQFNPKLTDLPALPLSEISHSVSTHSDANFPSLPLFWMPTEVTRRSILCSFSSTSSSIPVCSWSTCRQHAFSVVNFNKFSKNASASGLQYAPNLFPLESSTLLKPVIPAEFLCQSLPVSQSNEKKNFSCVDSAVTFTSDLSNHRKRFPRSILTSLIKRYNIWSQYISNNSHKSKI
ncbi:unnamed protein product, partial [Schistosoma turkestanicum]